MNPFITYKDTDKKEHLQYYIAQRDYPHFVGRIGYHPETVVVQSVPISGHNLFIIFAGTLSGMRIPALDKVDEQITSVMVRMSEWYFKNRIEIDPKRYKKFKINATSGL